MWHHSPVPEVSMGKSKGTHKPTSKCSTRRQGHRTQIYANIITLKVITTLKGSYHIVNRVIEIVNSSSESWVVKVTTALTQDSWDKAYSINNVNQDF